MGVPPQFLKGDLTGRHKIDSFILNPHRPEVSRVR